ncbi:MAG: PAS domain S-box protein [Gemmatimonadetes bacterium]|nr:PAS domain S-box protein [Gemmatimonadota bacterium]
MDAAEPSVVLDAWFESIPRGLAVLRPDGVVQRINATGADVWGGDRAILAGRRLWEEGVWPGDDADAVRVADAFRLARETGRADGEFTIRRGPGDEQILGLTFVAARSDRAEEPVLLELRDVTERQRLDRDLRFAHEKFAGMFSIAADAIITIDESQRILDFNNGAEQIFGWSAAEVLGRSLDVLIPPTFRRAHAGHVTAFAASHVAARRMGERRAIEGLRKDGRTFPAEASIAKLQVEGRRISMVVLRDTTDRQRALTAQRILARSGALLAHSLEEGETLERIAALTVESLGDACVVFATDPSGTIRRVATAAADGLDARDLEALRGSAVDPEKSHPVHVVLETRESVVLPRIDATRFARASREAEAAPLEPPGARSAVFAPLIARGSLHGAIAVFSKQENAFGDEEVDLIEELAVRTAMALESARLYRKAVEAVDARDDVLAVVSHDLGNPLSAIRIGVSLLLRNRPADPPPDSGWDHLAGIQQSVAQMERLIRDLLEIKRIEAGHLRLRIEDHAAAELLRDALELMSPIAQGRSLALRIVVADPSPVVQADRERTLQVLTNLLGNALKFTPDGGAIELAAVQAGDEVTFSVRDNGPGIARAEMEHIFDRFWQAQRKGREGLGFGLGLAIVRGIVEAHGGRAWAESEPGLGTTVSFTLPAGPRPAT